MHGIAYTRNLRPRDRFRFLLLDGGGTVEIAGPVQLRPAISPDGLWSVYPVTDSVIAGDLYLARGDGTGGIAVTPISHDGWAGLKWSPDSSRYAFPGRFPGPGRASLNVVDRRTSAVQTFPDLIEPGSHWAWSPDATRIALVTRNPHPDCADEAGGWCGGPALVVLTLATGEIEFVSQGFGDGIGAVKWSPDGSHIAYITEHQHQLRGCFRSVSGGCAPSVLMLMDTVYKSNQVAAVGLSRVVSPSWSPEW
jgi:Tol biopolymer transport system component